MCSMQIYIYSVPTLLVCVVFVPYSNRLLRHMISWDSTTESVYIKEGITCELDHLRHKTQTFCK
jgi:hypothetical protein